MKLKVAIGLALLAGVSTAADAAPPAGLSLGQVLTPVFKLVDGAGPLVSPLLQPVLSSTGPVAGQFVASLHPTFVMLGTLTGESMKTAPLLPALPGLPQ